MKANESESAKDKLKKELSKTTLMPETTNDESEIRVEKSDAEFQSDKPPHHA